MTTEEKTMARIEHSALMYKALEEISNLDPKALGAEFCANRAREVAQKAVKQIDARDGTIANKAHTGRKY